MSKLYRAILNREFNQSIIVEPLMALPGPVPNMLICRTPRTTKLVFINWDMLEEIPQAEQQPKNHEPNSPSQ